MLPAKDQENRKGMHIHVAFLHPRLYLPNMDTGTILVNPGGPGGSGTSFMARAGSLLSTVIGPKYDILGFDPRGIGATTPLAECFDSNAQFQIWGLQEGRLVNVSDYDTVTYALARSHLIGERCEKVIGGTGEESIVGSGTAEEWGAGKYMDTASVATDVVKISEAVGDDKVNYWGFVSAALVLRHEVLNVETTSQSYGTVLGQYFASIYPDKLGRFIIDGVYDAESYRAGVADVGVNDTDFIADAFYDFCTQAGPERCAVAEPTRNETYHRVKAIWDDLDASPIAIPFAIRGPAVLTADALRKFLFRATYKPVAQYPVLASKLAAIERRNASALGNLTEELGVPAYECNCVDERPWNTRNEAVVVITCTDSDVVSGSKEELLPYLQELTNTSSVGGPPMADLRIYCSDWKIRAKHRYMGPFEAAKTANPMLVVSTTWDPVCPLHHAKRVSERFPGSRLLEQRSHGHCSISSTSVCTAKAIRAYFEDGTLPDEGTICEPDELPLIGDVKSVHGMSRDDEELWNALKGLTKIDISRHIG